MSHQYIDDSYRPSRRRAVIQSHQPSDSSSRRNAPPTSRDFAFQSTFQPNRQRNPHPSSHHRYHGEYSHFDGHPNSTRLSSNRVHNSSNDQPHQRNRLEAPSAHSHVQHPQSYHDDHRDLFRSSNRHHFNSQQPLANHFLASQSNRYDEYYPRYERNSGQNNRRHHREEVYPFQSYPLHSNHRSVNLQSARQHSNPVRSVDHPSSSSHTVPNHRSSHPPMRLNHPISLLTHFLQSFFGRSVPSFNDDDDDDNDDDPSSSAPIDMIAFSWMMQRPDVPAILHIQFGDLLDLLAHDETPSVGLSDSDIERIPTMIYRKTRKSKSTDNKCIICLSKYKTGETLKRLRCEHVFHSECIDPWLKTSIQCPLCRRAQTD